jgi:hypothetical protein
MTGVGIGVGAKEGAGVEANIMNKTLLITANLNSIDDCIVYTEKEVDKNFIFAQLKDV